MEQGFGKDFVWGAATASYQIEGAAREEGKGLHIWDVFCQEKRRVFGGHTGIEGTWTGSADVAATCKAGNSSGLCTYRFYELSGE